MALFAAVILLGKRGAWLGALGGLGCGGAVGGLAYPSLGPPGAAVAAVVGLLLGIVLGFAPIFRDLKINERYITAGLRSSSRYARLFSPRLALCLELGVSSDFSQNSHRRPRRSREGKRQAKCVTCERRSYRKQHSSPARGSTRREGMTSHHSSSASRGR